MESNQYADIGEKLAKMLKYLRKWILPLTIVIVWISSFVIPIVLAERHGMIPEAIKNAPSYGYKISYDFGFVAAMHEILKHDFTYLGWFIICLTANGVFALMVTPLISKFLDYKVAMRAADSRTGPSPETPPPANDSIGAENKSGPSPETPPR